MESSSHLTPVYSYQKFKELADDRMSQVKIFIQTNETWESAGSGTIQFFQIDLNNSLVEIKNGQDYDPELKNFNLLIESSDANEISASEREVLYRNSNIFFSQKINNKNVIVFYNLLAGMDFEYDIESDIKRKSY